jgi:DNA (cytosine-5)-methyltransferase 1
MKFGSVCSGIEAASVAWGPLGWKAAWLSEIEPFPSAVLAHHYPDVPNLGDMTLLPERILSGEVEAPDVFCGGTPCQAFSVAGLRNSLDDARGNLSLTFVGIANAIDHVRSVRSEAPAIIFWENVPGVLSTKDNAFGCFLGALAGEDAPIIPSGGKWTNAGCVYGPQRAVAWRVLDAQYFGVAQRRRRVFVVASARDDFDPASVLFEFDGVRRDTAPSREKGKTIAPCVTNGPPFSRTGNERVEAEAMVVSRSHWDGDYPHPTLNQSAKGSGGVGSSNQEIFSQRGAYLAPAKSWPADIASTLDTTFGTKQGLEDQHVNAGCPLFVPAQTFSIPAIGHIVQDDVANTMTRHTGSGAGETQNPAFVAQPVATFSCAGIDAYTADTSAATLLKSGQDLGNGCEALVAQPMVLMDQGGSVMNVEHNMVGTLRRETHGHEPAVVQPPSMAVRRLTPVECERLQGFPDGYTNIPWRKKDESPDGPRYKALGNSWAVPVVRWIGERIAKAA